MQTTYTTAVIHSETADLSYRIEKRRDAYGYWHQRHMWTQDGGEFADPLGWIATKNRDAHPGPTFREMEAA